MNHRRNGFTVLELLIVVAIIGVLTAVIIVVVNNARSRAKDATIISEMKQFEVLLSLEYSENKNYAKLQTTGGNFIRTNDGCDTAFVPPPTGSKYYLKAREICKVIIANAPNRATQAFLADTVLAPVPPGSRNYLPQDDKYSIMAELNNGPYNNTFYCIGSSGTTAAAQYTNETGCWGRP